jgi:hypothetical protein
MKNKILLLSTLGLACGTAVQAATIEVTTNITSDTTWTSTNEYILTDIIFVNGGAELTIEEGTIVRGQPRTDNLTFDPGTLVITRDGTIQAEGTVANPIIFTTAAVDNDSDGVADDDDVDTFADRWTSGDTFLDASPATTALSPAQYDGGGAIVAGSENRGLWGGIIVLGEAPNNVDGVAGASLGENFIEGLPQTSDGIYGGFNPNDNSGVLSYISIRHGGTKLTANNEINGLTLGSVGNGTQIDHIDIYCNLDDGVEWFGGTVNSKNIAVIFTGDDGFDIDEGFTGINQFMFVLMNADGTNGERGGEHDGETDGTTDGLPKTFPTFYNCTYIGGGEDGFASADGFRLRDAWGGAYFNSIFTEFTDEMVTVEADLNDGTLNGGTRWTDGDIIFRYNLFWNVYDDSTTALNTVAAMAGSAAGSADPEDLFNNVGDNFVGNTIATPGFASIDRRAADGVNPVPLRNGGSILNIANAFGSEPYGATFVEEVSYKGAFSTDASAFLWTTGWTALNELGILVDRGSDSN